MGCVFVALGCALAFGLLVVVAAVAAFLLTERLPVAAPPVLFESRDKIRVSEESVHIISRQLGPVTIECRARLKNLTNRHQDPQLIFQFLDEDGLEIHRRRFMPDYLAAGDDELVIRHTTMNPEEFAQVKTFRITE